MKKADRPKTTATYEPTIRVDHSRPRLWVFTMIVDRRRPRLRLENPTMALWHRHSCLCMVAPPIRVRGTKDMDPPPMIRCLDIPMSR